MPKKSYSFTDLDYEYFEKIRKAFNEKHSTPEHKVDISIAEVIRIAMKFYGQRSNYITDQDL